MPLGEERDQQLFQHHLLTDDDLAALIENLLAAFFQALDGSEIALQAGVACVFIRHGIAGVFHHVGLDSSVFIGSV